MQPSKNNNVDELQQSKTNNTESSLDECSLQQSKTNNTESSPLQHEFIPGSAISLNHPTKTAFTVPKCLTSKECLELIQFAEDNGFETALLNAGAAQIIATDIRKSKRCMVDDPHLAEALYSRIQHLIPATLMKPRYNGQRYNGEAVQYRAVGLNERLRFLRYQEGDYFTQHMDGSYSRPTTHPNYGDVSLLTFLVYLNEEFTGGQLEMEFFDIAHNKQTKKTSIQPTPGIVVIHDHRIYHEAMLITSGTRYCIRTDVMYRPVDVKAVDEKKEEDMYGVE